MFGSSGSGSSFGASGERDVGYFFSELEQLLSPDARFLDIGCGIGRMDAVIAPKVIAKALQRLSLTSFLD